MRRSLRILLVANTLFELFVAAGSLLGGLLTYPIVPSQLLLGGNALALTTLSLLLVRSTNPSLLRTGVIVFCVFHCAITLCWLLASLLTGSFSPAAIGHGLFAAGFIAAYAQRWERMPLP